MSRDFEVGWSCNVAKPVCRSRPQGSLVTCSLLVCFCLSFVRSDLSRVYTLVVCCPVVYRVSVKKTMSLRSASKSDDYPRWTQLRDQLTSFSHSAYEYDDDSTSGSVIIPMMMISAWSVAYLGEYPRVHFRYTFSSVPILALFFHIKY